MEVYRCLASGTIISRGGYLFNNNKASNIVGGVGRVVLVMNLG